MFNMTMFFLRARSLRRQSSNFLSFSKNIKSMKRKIICSAYAFCAGSGHTSRSQRFSFTGFASEALLMVDIF